MLYPDLTLARVKDISLPRQRLVLLLGLVVALVRRLIAWLTDESLVFEILFARDGNAEPLKPERDLIEIALRESIVNGTVVLGVVTLNDVAARCSTIASTSACDALTVSTSDRALAAEGVAIARLRLDAAQPARQSPMNGSTSAIRMARLAAGRLSSSASWPSGRERNRRLKPCDPRGRAECRQTFAKGHRARSVRPLFFETGLPLMSSSVRLLRDSEVARTSAPSSSI